MDERTAETRPWVYTLTAVLELSDEELEAVADRVAPSGISLAYHTLDHELTFRGHTFSPPPWEAFGYLEKTLRELLPNHPVRWLDARIMQGETDSEVRAGLKAIGIVLEEK